MKIIFTAYVLVIFNLCGNISNAYDLVQIGYLGFEILVNSLAHLSTLNSQMYTCSSLEASGRPYK